MLGAQKCKHVSRLVENAFAYTGSALARWNFSEHRASWRGSCASPLAFFVGNRTRSRRPLKTLPTCTSDDGGIPKYTHRRGQSHFLLWHDKQEPFYLTNCITMHLREMCIFLSACMKTSQHKQTWKGHTLALVTTLSVLKVTTLALS